MRIVAILGVLILLVGGGLAVRFFMADGQDPMIASDIIPQLSDSGSDSTVDGAGDAASDAMTTPSGDQSQDDTMAQVVDNLQNAAQDTTTDVQNAASDLAQSAQNQAQGLADTANNALNQLSDGADDPLAQSIDDLRQTLDPGAVQQSQAGTADEPEDGPLRLSLPLDCAMGVDCYIQSFVNVGAPDDPRDYACGSLTYGEHRGTDFRSFDYTLMEDGIDVIAAAPGTVSIVRDGMPDANFRLFGRSAVTDRGRGNVVILDHDDGTQTAYSHLRRGSIQVSVGDRVARGQALAQMGMSGLTEFPHLHFEVVQNGQDFIDPFTGAVRHSGCGQEGEALWRAETLEQLTYPRTLIMHTGFADEILNRAAVEYGLFNLDGISVDASALVFHVYMAGIQPGDGFVAEITAPDGSRFVKSGREFDDFQMAELLAIGRADLVEPLQPGVYVATFSYFRQDETGQDVEVLNFEDSIRVR